MVRLAANLSMMFAELPFIDRFAAAARAGFDAVEFMFPYDHPAQVLADALAQNGLQLALFNMPAGDWAKGERGLGAMPGREQEFRVGAARAMDYAQVLGCSRLHMMAGITEGLDEALCRATMVANLRHVAPMAADLGIEILLEPINNKVDMPGYFYSTSAAAIDIMDAADCPNLRLQYDIYHMQIMEGDLSRSIARLLPRIGHIQLADNPGRGEPGTGEIHYPNLLRHIDGLGYQGFIGCEYRPVGATLDGLGWAAPYLSRAAGDMPAARAPLA